MFIILIRLIDVFLLFILNFLFLLNIRLFLAIINLLFLYNNERKPNLFFELYNTASTQHLHHLHKINNIHL
jgi:hypothetical protein